MQEPHATDGTRTRKPVFPAQTRRSARFPIPTPHDHSTSIIEALHSPYLSSKATISSIVQTRSTISAATMGDVLSVPCLRAKSIYRRWSVRAAMWFSTFFEKGFVSRVKRRVDIRISRLVSMKTSVVLYLRSAYNGRLVKWDDDAERAGIASVA